MREEEPGTEEVTVAAYDRAMERALASALRHRRALLRGGELAAAALAPVLAGERAWRRLTPREARAARTPPLVELLLARSHSLRYDDPAGMLELARLALAVAERLKPGRCEAGLLADLRARCWCELANACRLADQLALAWQALGEAVEWAARGSGALPLAGRVPGPGPRLPRAPRRFAGARRPLAGPA